MRVILAMSLLMLLSISAMAQDPSKVPADKALKISKQIGAISQNETKASTTVCRSKGELKKALGKDATMAPYQGHLKNLDFSKHMAVVIRNGQVNAFGTRVSVQKALVADDGKSATIHWQFRPYFGGAAPPRRPGNPMVVALVNRFNGKVGFKKSVWQYPKGLPLPPSAPPAPPPAVPRPPR